jgi:hypothetical protein
MRKVIAVILAVGALAVVLVVVVALRRESGTPGVMSLDEANRRVEKLKEQVAMPIDELTREKIAGFIEELPGEREFVDVNGIRSTLAAEARAALRAAGKAAIPQLIQAASKHPDRHVRQGSLGVIYSLIRKGKPNRRLEYVPVFVRSMHDTDPQVRGTALSEIGDMAYWLRSQGHEEELAQVIPYLVMGLADEHIQATAGANLFRIDRNDLVPDRLVQKYKLGTEHIDSWWH